MKNSVNKRIIEHLNHGLDALEVLLGSDVLIYNGPIMDGNENVFLQIVEDLISTSKDETVIEGEEKKSHSCSPQMEAVHLPLNGMLISYDTTTKK
jgi:hypothetical protein